jgi:hypothetical protein
VESVGAAVGAIPCFVAPALGKRRAAADWSQHEVSVPMKQHDVKTVVISMKVPVD